MNKKDMLANGITILGVGAMLAIAGLPLAASATILGFTAGGCYGLTVKGNSNQKEEQKQIVNK